MTGTHIVEECPELRDLLPEATGEWREALGGSAKRKGGNTGTEQEEE